MAGPKVVVVGAGSYFFGRPVIWNMTHSEVLRPGTLALVDVRPDVLKTMMNLARRTVAATGAPTRLEGSTELRDVLKGADFVVLTFSDRNAHFRGVDCEVALNNGIRMCSGDTIGPGGIFRGLREVPKALAMAAAVRELAPQAWIVNFVNPTTVLGMALRRYAPEVRSFAICDGLHEPRYRLRALQYVGVLPADATRIPPELDATVDLRVAGVNHFTWMIRFEVKGRNLLPAWRERLKREAEAERREAEAERLTCGGATTDNNAYAKARFNRAYAYELMRVFGAYPDRIAHTKEYVPYFQGYGKLPCEPEPIAVFDARQRAAGMAERWTETEAYAEGRKPIQEFVTSGKPDHATDIIESMWGGLDKPFFVNTANRGAVTNMSDDAFLELRCDIDMNGPRPQPVGGIPVGLRGLQERVLDVHELTAEAAVTCDRRTLLQAFMTDPIVGNIPDARAIIEELLACEADALPARWQAR